MRGGRRIGIVAGEPSGDILGGRLMAALRTQCPGASFTGVGGEQMLEQGLDALAPIESLSVHGFRDPLRKLPELLRLLDRLRRHFLAERADVVVGVDFNVFNLILERLMKRRGVPTAHYVSPSVYAWREWRTRRIGRAADVVMALYPFEPPLYERRGARAEFVGHPTADEIGFDDGSPASRQRARAELDLPSDRFVLGLLPGSRLSEIAYMAPTFFAAAQRAARVFRDPLVVVPTVSDAADAAVASASAGFAMDVRRVRGRARLAMAAADMLLVKSGTATLEAMLLRRPMVVAYRMGAAAAAIVRLMKTTPHVALPNILAGRELVPEVLQEMATPEVLGDALIGTWRRVHADPGYFEECARLHRLLRCDGAARAAEVVLGLIDARPGGV